MARHGTQTSLLEAANYIATIEHRQGLKVACLEEVALRMGFVDESQIERLIGGLPKGEYRSYLELRSAPKGRVRSIRSAFLRDLGWRKKA